MNDEEFDDLPVDCSSEEAEALAELHERQRCRNGLVVACGGYWRIFAQVTDELIMEPPGRRTFSQTLSPARDASAALSRGWLRCGA
jgi:hypothetical protein